MSYRESTVLSGYHQKEEVGFTFFIIVATSLATLSTASKCLSKQNILLRVNHGRKVYSEKMRV